MQGTFDRLQLHAITLRHDTRAVPDLRSIYQSVERPLIPDLVSTCGAVRCRLMPGIKRGPDVKPQCGWIVDRPGARTDSD